MNQPYLPRSRTASRLPLPLGKSTFRRYVWLSALMFVVMAACFSLYVRSEKSIDRANDSRVQLLLLGLEMRHSFQTSARLARAYVSTGDSTFRREFEQVLLVRAGKGSMPPDASPYSSLLLPGTQNLLGGQRPRSVLEVAQQVGVSPDEYLELQEAERKSNELAGIERQAMDLYDHSNLTVNERRLRALALLYDPQYIGRRGQVMAPLDRFAASTDARMRKAVDKQIILANTTRAVVIGAALVLMLVLYLAYRALQQTLGGPLEDIQRRIVRLGQGDFQPAEGTNVAGVAGWLNEAEGRLSTIEAGRDAELQRNERLRDLYRALLECNQAIVRCQSKQELFEQICRDVVRLGGLDMAWIGMADADERVLAPVASYGDGVSYLSEITVSLDPSTPEGSGPTARSFENDRPIWCNDFGGDPATLPWRAQASRFGWSSSAALPLHNKQQVVGVLSLYSRTLGAFDEAARSLLSNLAHDIDSALRAFADAEQRQLALSALAQSRWMLRTIIDANPTRIFWKDAQSRYLGCNLAFARDAGLSSPDEVIGKHASDMWPSLGDKYQAADREVLETRAPKLSYVEPFLGRDGSKRWMRTSKMPLYGEDGELIGVLGTYEDVTEERSSAERIHYLANFDALTGLPNRASLEVAVKSAINGANRENAHTALMFLDLDHFKDVNDGLGHSIGDAVLVELARRLHAAMRERDVVSRLGGDEFVLLLPDTDARTAGHVAERLLHAIGQHYAIGEYNLALSASIGIAMYPRDGTDIETLFKSADAAMYAAKREGRRGYCFSTPEIHGRTARNLKLVGALADALANGDLHVHFQPQISLSTGRVVGLEALTRWHHPQLGLISPSEFIPVAEESGHILAIGDRVLRDALRHVRGWTNQGLEDLSVSVNLSVVQLRNPTLTDTVARILSEEGVEPKRLVLELTESAAMNNPEQAIATMLGLHGLGVGVSIDDFGTGYSSLSYLKRFKAQKIKIDQSFVRDITDDPEDRAIVCAVIQMAKQLGMQTVAEGVELPEQLEYLRQQGCDEVQGFYCGRPIPADLVPEYLRASSTHV